MMKQKLSEKEILLTALTDIYDRLDELEQALEASFSDLRLSLCNEAFEKMMIPQKKLSVLESEYVLMNPLSTNEVTAGPQKQTLKLELGF